MYFVERLILGRLAAAPADGMSAGDLWAEFDAEKPEKVRGALGLLLDAGDAAGEFDDDADRSTLTRIWLTPHGRRRAEALRGPRSARRRPGPMDEP